MNDPFNNFQPLNGKVNQKPDKKRSNNFVESIRNVGDSAVKTLKNKHVKDGAKSIYQELVNSSQTSQAPDRSTTSPFSFEDWLKGREEQAAQEADQKARQEERAHFNQVKSQEKVLFSMADEKIQQEIKEIRQELALLIKSMGKVEKQIEQAVIQEVVDPGLYHLNFFAKLKGWIVLMRKSMEDASLWLSMSSTRKKKGIFWQKAKSHGTKYSMSQERQSAMSIG